MLELAQNYLLITASNKYRLIPRHPAPRKSDVLALPENCYNACKARPVAAASAHPTHDQRPLQHLYEGTFGPHLLSVRLQALLVPSSRLFGTSNT